MKYEQQNEQGEVWVSAKFLAEKYGIAERTWANYRSNGAGPPFKKFSARMVRYRIIDVQLWLEEKIQKLPQNINF